MADKLVHITFDYELFFGPFSGTVLKCLIEPTNQLIELAKSFNISFVFFIDAGFVYQLKQNLHIAQCVNDYSLVSSQIKKLNELGHQIALHVHPHWEDSNFEDGVWQMNTQRYKFANFSEPEIESIISKYHQALIEITGKSCTSFRAGGWCIQPFSKIKNALFKNNIFVDSSVYKNGYHQFTAQSYDFRKAPHKSKWQFEDNECVEKMDGLFTEIAITSDTIPPLFFVYLYLKMKLNPTNYKPIGDGVWLKDKKKIYKQFYTYSNHFASCDGYFASRLKSILLKQEKLGNDRIVILGHPKSLALCSLELLNEFIKFSTNRGYKITTLE